jgi:hypothetical protein
MMLRSAEEWLQRRQTRARLDALMGGYFNQLREDMERDNDRFLFALAERNANLRVLVQPL